MMNVIRTQTKNQNIKMAGYQSHTTEREQKRTERKEKKKKRKILTN
jgi:hypothetical protein